MKLKLADTYLKLGEIGMETGMRLSAMIPALVLVCTFIFYLRSFITAD